MADECQSESTGKYKMVDECLQVNVIFNRLVYIKVKSGLNTV
jgi:hypothetical protein